MPSGVYIRTEATKEKFRNILKQLWKNDNNYVRRGQISFANDDNKVSEHSKHIWKARHLSGNDKHSEQTKQKIREKRKLQIITKKHRENISLGLSKATMHFTPMFYSEKLGHKVRSYFEENMMCITQKFDKDYVYEKKYPVIEDGIRHFYFVDQFFPKRNIAIEYKGFLQFRKINKYRNFKMQYPDIRFALVLKKDILDRSKFDLSFFDDIVTTDKFETWCCNTLGGGDLYGRT